MADDPVLPGDSEVIPAASVPDPGARERPVSVRAPLVGDQVSLRKPHACGGSRWTVTRIGADIGLECGACHRRILLSRDDFRRCLKGYDRD